MSQYTIVSDGAYSSTRDQGGCAFVMLKDDEPILEFSKSFKHTTNNVMEIIAIYLGLRSIKAPIESLHIVSDSQYALGTIFKGWKRNKNKKLLELVDKEVERVRTLCPKVTLEHIRGHGKGKPTKWDKWNDYVDKMCVKASQSI